ncbi:piggyBac transposable element-derived protein 2-like [Anthonomus grandis grandis]|uniref:piggyBac transposable element-derived protein 2-like n=1 Tax=Anthonomus grandis grandis TaxID=2921223 RepID=UPI002166B3CB|nr:piggyBac transposable element-derived protein 2-like [Anthonomus grandis grandis]
MNRHSFKNLDDAVEYLYSNQIDADIALLPPEVDQLTDVDDIDDGHLRAVDVQDVPGVVEIQVEEQNDWESEDDLPLSNFIKRKKVACSTKSWTLKWTKEEPIYENIKEEGCAEAFNKIKEELQELTPLQIFEKFFDDDLYNLLQTETMRYAQQKNKYDFFVTSEDLKIFIGFLIFSGYHDLPSERGYWSEREDLGVPLVKNAFSRNAYKEIESCLHFADNFLANDNKDDKSFKIGPLFGAIKTKFQQWGVFHTFLSIDEMNVKYFGHHGLK